MLHAPPASEHPPAPNDDGPASERDAEGTTRVATAPSFVAAAERRLAATCERVTAFGRRLAESGCTSDEDRDAWVAVHAKLRADVSALAGAVSALAIGAPERESARKLLGKLGERLTRIELPVLARLEPAFAKSWMQYNGTTLDLDGAALSARLEFYGLTPDELHRYVLTGNAPVGLARALADAQRNGAWHALGVVTAAYQMRAGYLRATAPACLASARDAERLAISARQLSEQRAAIHLNWGAATAARLNRKYPDAVRRPKQVQRQIDAARQAVASVRQHAIDQVTAHPQRYGKNSTLRTLAADGLLAEAQLALDEAMLKMEREAEALAQATQAQNIGSRSAAPWLLPPPPKLHPDLAEGGTVDRKRCEALALDPRIGDVLHGGDRGLRFVCDLQAIRRLRLHLAEQQVAHLASRQQPPPAQLVAKVRAQLEGQLDATHAAHQTLVRATPGTLDVGQTLLLADLDNDTVTLTGKIAAARREGSVAERIEATARRGKEKTLRELEDFTRTKIALAQQALAASAGHMNAIPARGGERIARLQAAIDHRVAVTQLSRLLRDHAGVPASVALKGASAAADEIAGLCKQIDVAFEMTQAKLPRLLRDRQAGEVQACKEELQAQQVRAHRVVADLAGNLDLQQALAQSDHRSHSGMAQSFYMQGAGMNKLHALGDSARHEATTANDGRGRSSSRARRVVQAAMGLAIDDLPISAQQLAAAPDLAEKLGTATEVFLPRVFGAIAGHASLRRADCVLVQELDLDPARARTLMGEVLQALGRANPLAGVGLMRERASRMVDVRFANLGPDARAAISDSLTLDVVRKRFDVATSREATPAQHVDAVEAYYALMECDLVRQGVKLERARELAFDEKTAMYDEALAKTNALLAAAGDKAPTVDANAAAGACALSRHLVEKLAPRAGSAAVGRIVTPLHGVPLSPQQRAKRAAGRGPGSIAPESVDPPRGLPRVLLDAAGVWPSLETPERTQDVRLITVPDVPLRAEPDDEHRTH